MSSISPRSPAVALEVEKNSKASTTTSKFVTPSNHVSNQQLLATIYPIRIATFKKPLKIIFIATGCRKMNSRAEITT